MSNLHYFDDLNAANNQERAGDHAVLIAKWIDENPAPVGNGWVPYPLLTKLTILIPKALHWLAAMSHNDGEISFLNDATHDIAWSNTDINVLLLMTFYE